MSRTSRILHPPGSLFIQLHEWIVRTVGRDAAAVIGVVEFLDRAQEEARQPVITRKRLVAELDGIVGETNIDKAIKRLVELGWLKKVERTEFGQKNITHWLEFALDDEAINSFLSMTPDVPNLRRRKSQKCDQKKDVSKQKEVDIKNHHQTSSLKSGGGSIEPKKQTPATTPDGEQSDADLLQEFVKASGLAFTDDVKMQLAHDLRLSAASIEQARWSGEELAEFVFAGKSSNPIGLARTLAKRAGGKQKPNYVDKAEKTAECIAFKEAQKKLAGRRFIGIGGDSIEYVVDRNGSIVNTLKKGDPGASFLIDAMFVAAVEDGRLQEVGNTKKAA